MEKYTLEQQRKRIQNINHAEQGNKRYFRRHRIRDYIPGQATYNLGDYPSPFTITPTEYDEQMLKNLSENGVGLIQIHEEWNDSIRCMGADKLSSHDPKGLQKFVDLCHSFGIRIIPYISTGYFQATDPDFKEIFTRNDLILNGDYFRYRRCWAGSPHWREYLIPRILQLVDQYGFDGIYNDWGYDGVELIQKTLISQGKDPRKMFCFDMPYDPDLEDLLSILYSEIKSRRGICKLHADINNTAPCKDKVYDYLWIGECVRGDSPLGIGKDYEQYIVPCQHGLYAAEKDPDAYYARVIPFMQFPLLKTGRPMLAPELGEFTVNTGYTDFKQKTLIREYMKTHPQGPYVYSLWSSVPEDVEEYPRWCRYLALYQPMVEENSLAYIELSECEEILSPLSNGVVASMFVNEETYLVVSNLSEASYTLMLRDLWKDRETGIVGKSFSVEKGKICFLIKE